MEDVWQSLQAYYDFLAGQRIVDAADFESLQNTILDTKNEFLDKMEQYNAIRHDDSLSEKKKEQIRQKLFGDDMEEEDNKIAHSGILSIKANV
jgi:hypothetical protein